MKIVTIIGGSGFVGKSYLDAYNKGFLNKFKINRINIICRNPKKISLTITKSSNINLIKGDISTLKSIPKSDLIIYAADKANLSKLKNHKNFLSKSKKSINNFCKIIKKMKHTKILYISSGSIYKYKKKNLFKEKKLTDRSLYTYIKYYSEDKIIKLKKYQIKTSIARCFTFVGRWLPRNEQFAIGNFINDGLNKKDIRVKSNSRTIRSYMFSDDLAFWLTKIGFYSKIKTQIFDIGSDKPIEIHNLAKLIGKIFKKNIIFNNNKLGQVDKYLPNIKKAKEHLKLKITYDLKKAILLTIKEINDQTY